jgi:hypothetical protein
MPVPGPLTTAFVFPEKAGECGIDLHHVFNISRAMHDQRSSMIAVDAAVRGLGSGSE